MEQQHRIESAEKLQVSKKQLDRSEKRIAELKRLFIKIYEDNASGKLSDDRYDMLSQTYEAEQKQLEADVRSIKQDTRVKTIISYRKHKKQPFSFENGCFHNLCVTNVSGKIQ